MSDKDSGNSGSLWDVFVAWLWCSGLASSIIQSIWPKMDTVLLCILAPIGGLILGLLWVWLWSVGETVIKRVYLLVTAPPLAFLGALLISIGTGAFLLFGWADVPVAPGWTMIDAAAIGILSGFIVMGLVRTFKSDSWILQAAIAGPVAIGLAYLVAISLHPGLGISWLIWTLLIMLPFLFRLVYEQREISKREAYKATYQWYPPIGGSYLPQSAKQRLLQQIRDQIGAAQYDQLVNVIGEDEILRQVLANTK